MADVNPGDLLKQAVAMADENQHWQAIDLYTELLSHTQPQTEGRKIKEMRLKALSERGRLLRLLGEQGAALASYQQYYLEAGTSRHSVDALVLIGNQCTYMGLFDRADGALDEALQLAEALNYTAGRAKALGGKGIMLLSIGRGEEAVVNLEKSRSLFEQLNDQVEQARAWNRIGVAYIRLGKVDKAILAFKRSSEMARATGRKEPVALETAIDALNNLGECFQFLFDMEQALTHHQEGLAIAKSLGLPYLQVDLRRNLGVDLLHLGRVTEGLAQLYRSLKLSQQTDRPDIKLQVLYSLALAEIQQGDREKGLAYAQQLKELAEQGKTRGHLACALHAIGLYHQVKGEAAVAEQMWQQALFLAHETGQRILLWQIHAAVAEIASTPALAAVHNRIAAEVIQHIVEPIEDEELCQRFLTSATIQRIFALSRGEAAG